VLDGQTAYDRRDIVAHCAKSADNSEIATLVSEEPHRLVSAVAGVLADENDLFVGDGVCRVSHRRLDILAGEVGVGVQKVRLGGAFAQFSEDQLDRNPCSTDAGKRHDTVKDLGSFAAELQHLMTTK
jgi:hypothetical protein